jgi:hypothetical protein
LILAHAKELQNQMLQLEYVNVQTEKNIHQHLVDAGTKTGTEPYN